MRRYARNVSHHAQGPIETLERWAQFGGHWRVVELADDHAIVELRACTGERMDRLESGEESLIAYVRDHGLAHPLPPAV